jgi:hypothetical protein
MSFLGKTNYKKNKEKNENREVKEKDLKKVIFVHSVFEILEYNKKYYAISLTKDDENTSLFNRWHKILEELFSKYKQGDNYLLKIEDIDDFIEFVQNLDKKYKRKDNKDNRSYEQRHKHYSSDSESESRNDKYRSNNDSESEGNDQSENSNSEDSTDDELIQKTLSRRLKSTSNQQDIDNENISDSEMEDVISICRRMRYLLKNINEIKNKVLELERKLGNQI